MENNALIYNSLIGSPGFDLTIYIFILLTTDVF